MRPSRVSSHTLLKSVGATALCGALAFLLWPAADQGPVASSTPSSGQVVGVGALLEGPKDSTATQDRQAARAKAATNLPGAPQPVLALAERLYMGDLLLASDLEGVDPELLAYVFHAPHALDAGGGSLAREAAALGRVDVLKLFGQHGVSTQADDGLLFWATIEHWTHAAQSDARAILQQAAVEDSVHRAHEDGFTALELAATVSLEAVQNLVETGANPWTHPNDPDALYGFPSVMERLSLHASAPGAIGVLGGIVELPALPTPTERALLNTLGNLIDSAVFLASENSPVQARQAVHLALALEDRFGPAPAHYWTQEARDLRPANAPALPPLDPLNALATIPPEDVAGAVTFPPAQPAPLSDTIQDANTASPTIEVTP